MANRLTTLLRRAAHKVQHVFVFMAPQKAENAPEVPPRVIREHVHVKMLALPADEVQGPMHIDEIDQASLLERHGLSSFAQIEDSETARYVDDLLPVQRFHALELDGGRFEFPEASLKRIYNAVTAGTDGGTARREEVSFDGRCTSELNAFMHDNRGKTINVIAPRLELDETISVSSETSLCGHGVRLVPGKLRVQKAIVLDGVTDTSITGFAMRDCCDYAIYVKNSERFVVSHNTIESCGLKSICIMGSNQLFKVTDNSICDSGNGGIFLNGDIRLGIIEGNDIRGSRGTTNFHAGIMLDSLAITDIDTAANPWQPWDPATKSDCPRQLVITRNVVRGNRSSGLYSLAGYDNYIVDNIFEENNKEGMCLDFCTCCCYVARNVFRRNGGRFHMDERQLAEDFITDFGLLADGSSPAKVPGISFDNASYNIIYQNIISENYGSGIKMVRTGIRNVILCNEISNNNRGQNKLFHYFGVELGSDLRPDCDLDGVRELDFAPCYQNIIARNTITGDHYFGILLAPGACGNLVSHNVVMDTPLWLEDASEKQNVAKQNLYEEEGDFA